MNYLIVTFSTITDAISCDKQMKKLGLEGRLVPIPRQLSADCGMVWRGKPEDEAKTRDLLSEAYISYEEIITLKM